ncbi:hypothetical protein DE146DRAFT_744748 [Phaeosphaeria sp. MPI-PUGE-AT-0046c]|nr:hypothetical protein DE146DRAFT_744748 [Phaeosphaeria sp. MPI-PUGE-AT-0046c]
MSTADASYINVLKGSFSEQSISLQGTEQFDKLNKTYLSLLQIELTPAVIVLPHSSSDGCKFVKLIRPYVLKGETHFAIRGADLRNLTGIEIEDDAVSIGAGERWGKVYEEVTKRGLGVTGSRSALGGIGGLALAGGLSFFSSREGFICDNVVDYEVVQADGSLVHANSKDNPELFRAFRGGGNNFGVVTRYKVRTFKQGPFWGGAVFYFPDSFPGQIQAYCDELHRPNATEETHIMISQGFSHVFAELGSRFCMNQLYYTGEVHKPQVLERFNVQPQIDAMNSTRMMSLQEAAEEQVKQSSDGVRCAYMNTTVKADAATLVAATAIFNAAYQPLKDLEGVTSAFTLQAYTVSLLKRCENNSLGLNAIEGPLMSNLVLNWWKNQEDDDLVISTFRKALNDIDADVTSRGTDVPYKYMNYAYSFQDPIGSYVKENREFLLKTSLKYDPQGLFQKGCLGGFKLGGIS